MNVRILILLIVFFGVNHAFGQNPILDSLKNELNKHPKKDSVYVDILHDIAHNYRGFDIKIAETKCNEAYRLAVKLNYKEGIAMNSLIQSKIHLSKSEFKEASADAIKSLKKYQTIENNADGLIAVYNTLGMLGNYQNDADTALYFFKKGMDLAINVNDLEKEGNMLNNIGITFYTQGMLDSALVYYGKSIEIDQKRGDNSRLASSLNNMSIIYSIQGRYSEALEINNKILNIRTKENQRNKIAQINQNIGILYNQMEKYQKALVYHEKALEIYRDLKDKLSTAKVLNSIGNTLIELNRLEDGIDYLNEALILSEETNNNDVLIMSHNSIGKIRIQMNEFQAALMHFHSALELSEQLNDQRNIGIAHINIGNVQYLLGNYKKSLEHTLLGREIADELDMLVEQRDASQILSQVYAKLGKYDKAFEFHQKFKTYSDSLFNKEKIEKIAQIEYEFKFQKEKEIFNAKEQKLTKKVESTSKDLEKSQNRLLWGVVLFLAILLVAVMIIFQMRIRNVKSKSENSLLEQKLLRSQMTPHFIFNSLSVLQGMILNKEEVKANQYLSKFSRLLRVTLEISREKMTPLSQELLALEHYVALQNLESDKSLEYQVNIDDKVQLDEVLIPPMLIQPFIENAIEHGFTNESFDKKIELFIHFKEKDLYCIIRDNGIGVEATKRETSNQKKSLATSITKERIQLLSKEMKTSGSIEICDRKIRNEQGTEVTLVIPHKVKTA